MSGQSVLPPPRWARVSDCYVPSAVTDAGGPTRRETVFVRRGGRAKRCQGRWSAACAARKAICLPRTLDGSIVTAVGTGLRLRHVRSGADPGQLEVRALPGGPHGPGQVPLGPRLEQLRALQPLLVVGDVGSLQQDELVGLLAVTRDGEVEVRPRRAVQVPGQLVAPRRWARGARRRSGATTTGRNW